MSVSGGYGEFMTGRYSNICILVSSYHNTEGLQIMQQLDEDLAAVAGLARNIENNAPVFQPDPYSDF